ncbi:C1D-domain-containing protein [Gyrodon lividus]|nr:C1D-domain-containing protein [Gyrodon lividus]
MSTDSAGIRSKLTKLNKSLDELESQLEPLFSQSLPETLLGLETIHQAKLQVIIPYIVYDLVFVYLKSRGIDPRTHPIVNELERVRQYFDKIKNAEEFDQKRKLGIDKAAAGRFIKHAIAQAKNAQLMDEPSDDATPVASSGSKRVPVKVTSKMIARAEYEKEIKELGNEEEEDLEVFDDDDDDAMDIADGLPEEARTRPLSLNKGKGRASNEEQSSQEDQAPTPRRKRPRIDPFSEYEGVSISSVHQPIDDDKKKTTSTKLSSASDSLRGTPISASEDIKSAKGAKKAKRKARKP